MRTLADRRAIDLSQLSAKECVLLSKRAESLCVERLTALAANLAPSDAPLSRSIAEVAEEEQLHLERIAALDEQVPWPALLRLDEPGFRLLLATHLPSLHAGCASLDTDAIQHFIVALEQESASLYRALSSHAADARLKSFFAQTAADEERHRDRFGASDN